MKTFMSLFDLEKLDTDDPARPVVRKLLEWLIADGEFPDHPYNPDDHGYIALVEPGDVDRELDDLDMPRLTEILWEGVSIVDGYYPRRVPRFRRLRYRIRYPDRCPLDQRRAAGGAGVATG